MLQLSYSEIFTWDNLWSAAVGWIKKDGCITTLWIKKNIQQKWDLFKNAKWPFNSRDSLVVKTYPSEMKTEVRDGWDLNLAIMKKEAQQRGSWSRIHEMNGAKSSSNNVLHLWAWVFIESIRKARSFCFK